MKKILLPVIVLITTITGCQKEANKIFGCTDPSASNYNYAANTDNGTCQYTGKATFWYNSSGTQATVHIGTYTGYVTSYYPSYDPSCGASGCANFTLPAGSYSYSASSTWSNWSGTVTVTSNGCTRVCLL